MFPGKYPTSFVAGFAYIMSAAIVPKLYEAALTVPIVTTEDVFITGLTAYKIGVQAEKHPW